MLLAPTEYQKLDLWTHSFLRDVPLHDAFVIDLPGGGKGRTVSDLHALFSAEKAMKANPDRYERHSYLYRLDADERARSLIAPGTPDGPFRLLNVLPREAVREVQNATVHAFLAEALRETDSGYRLYWRIYVKPASRLTPLYMALIKPFRHWLVYPAMLRRIREVWMGKYGSLPDKATNSQEARTCPRL